MTVAITAPFYASWGHSQSQDTHRYIGKSTHSRERSCCSELKPVPAGFAHYSGLLQGLTSLFAAESHKAAVSGSNEASAGAENASSVTRDTIMHATRRTTTQTRRQRIDPAITTGCDGSGHPRDTLGCPTFEFLKQPQTVSNGCLAVSETGCDGWDTPNQTYRGARARAPGHTRRAVDAGWTRPTRHGVCCRVGIRGYKLPIGVSQFPSRDTPGCPTAGAGCPANKLTVLPGGGDGV